MLGALCIDFVAIGEPEFEIADDVHQQFGKRRQGQRRRLSALSRALTWPVSARKRSAMEGRVLFGYAHGRPGAWEAMCVDLDIAVQGASFDAVRDLLNEAVASYAEDALKEAPRDAERLLRRRAPPWVQLKFVWLFLAHIALRRRANRELRAGFDIPCPA